MDRNWKGEPRRFFGRDKIVTFCVRKKDNEPYLREMNVNNRNLFREISKESKEEVEIVKMCPGNPIYYKDYNSGAYLVAIINEYLEFQYIGENSFKFLNDMLIKGRLLRKKFHKGIDKDNM